MTHRPNTWPFMASEAVRHSTGSGAAGRTPTHTPTPSQPQQDEATPGQGENQAGFIQPKATPLTPRSPDTPE